MILFNLIRSLLNIHILKAIPEILFKYIPMYLLALCKKKPQQMWLITERKNDARDNGFILFKFLRENHPELLIFYAINSHAQDYRKLETLGNTIEWGTLKHYYHYFASSLLLSSGFEICAPNLYPLLIMKKFLPTKAKRVFLQHGIIKDHLPHAHKNKLKANLFICGAYPEYLYINRNFGYAEGEVVYTGLARYDMLENTCTKNQILYMPTWRLGLGNKKFQDSCFFLTIASFLSSKSLQTYLEESCTEFVFFLHPAIRNQKESFKSFETTRLHIMNNDDCDLQQLLKSATLLITDYSSIYFDFAYLNKPLIYYHFDYDEYRKRHYPTGYFDYKRDGFGPVFHTEKEVLVYIQSITNSNWKNPEEYNRRTEYFFKYRDYNNCQRHYEILRKLDNLQ